MRVNGVYVKDVLVDLDQPGIANVNPLFLDRVRDAAKEYLAANPQQEGADDVDAGAELSGGAAVGGRGTLPALPPAGKGKEVCVQRSGTL